MSSSPALTAHVLVEALPYIQRFAGKAVVVKLGGAAIDAELDRALAQDVLLLRSVGVRCVLVHGGGPQVDAMMKQDRQGARSSATACASPMPRRSRIVRMVLVGKINRDLVAHDQPRGARRSGRGRRGRRGWRAARSPRRAIPRSASSATSPRSAPSVLHGLLDEGLAPVVSTIGADPSGQPYNINADEAAMAIAVAMGAEKIVYLTAAPGLLEDVDRRSQPGPAPDLGRAARADRA